MNLASISLVILLATMLQACAHRLPFTDDERRRMNEAAARLGPQSLAGVTVQAPRDIGWRLIARDQSLIAYRKTLAENHTLAAMVTRHFPYNNSFNDPWQFFESVRPAVVQRLSKGGAVVADAHTYNPAFGIYSFQSHITRSVPLESSSGGVAYEHWYLFTFLHPDENRVLYTVSYSERSHSQAERDALRGEAAQFFNLVQIDALHRQAR